VTEPEPSRIQITFDGQRAISAPLAAKRHRTPTDTMRKTIARLRAAGAIEPFDEGLDERTELYPLDQLDAALKERPGKGANLRQREVRPMAELTDEQQPAYEAAAVVFVPYSWPTEVKERAAREIATQMWIQRDERGVDAIRAITEDDSAWRPHVDGLVSSLRLQGAQVTPIPIGKAVRAVAALLGRG
jgi:hypothetical protein